MNDYKYYKDLNINTINSDDVLEMRSNEMGEVTFLKFKLNIIENIDIFTTENVKYVFLYYIDLKTVKLKIFRIINEIEGYEELQEITLNKKLTFKFN